jgi:hypothetical protein
MRTAHFHCRKAIAARPWGEAGHQRYNALIAPHVLGFTPTGEVVLKLHTGELTTGKDSS